MTSTIQLVPIQVSGCARGLFGAQGPGDGAAVADLVIRCHERDLALSLELAADLAVQRLLVGFNRQEEVGPLLLELPKNISHPIGHPLAP
jgi:hypothetical protein